MQALNPKPQEWTMPETSDLMTHATPRARRGFTIIELLVVVAIIGLLVALLLPAIGRARDSALTSQSMANMRNLGAGAGMYSAAWNERQFTGLQDDFAKYTARVGQGSGADYRAATGTCPPSLVWGWGGYDQQDVGQCQNNRLKGIWANWICDANVGGPAQWGWNSPFTFDDWVDDAGAQYGGGMWVMANCRNFNQYVGGKFYDKVFYSPRDKVSLDRAQRAFEIGDDFTLLCSVPVVAGTFDGVVWSTYTFSPAGLYSSEVFSAKNGCTKFGNRPSPGLFRTPSYSQAAYPELKTMIMERWWLQNREGPEFNPGFSKQAPARSRLAGGTPYMFNQCINSTPCTVYYDGHTATSGCSSSMAEHASVASGNANAGLQEPGLFAQRTLNNLTGPWAGWGGYFTGPEGSSGAEQFNYDDEVNTSFHVFTVDGILGRDFITAK
jgi:prepilin-type N-terminal cleavage/methylation domain-containing protein